MSLPEINVNEFIDWKDRRKEIIDILQDNIYGRTIENLQKLDYDLISNEEDFAGKANVSTYLIYLQFEKGIFDFKFRIIKPKKFNGKTILHLAFSDSIDDKYSPMEEIIDNGYSVAYLFYEDITKDDDDFDSGIARYCTDSMDSFSRSEFECGKISMWAFASSRVVDVLLGLGLNEIYMIGHSRLGKTALWCAAQDERICGVMSNESGCGGAAITRGKQGEKVKDITGMFPFWFCNKYKEYSENEENMPFDQHFLLALIAPRKLLVSSAAEDIWADPEAEKKSYQEALKIYDAMSVSHNISYYARPGTHFLSRTDWNMFMDFINK